MIAALEKDYHQKANNFARSLVDHEKGKWGVFPVHHFCLQTREPLPDYSNCFGIFRNKAEADQEKRRQATLRQQCCVVVQI